MVHSVQLVGMNGPPCATNGHGSPNLNPIASALRDRPNIAQFVKCCAIDKVISGTARLVKHAIDQMRTIAIVPLPSEAIHSRKIKF